MRTINKIKAIRGEKCLQLSVWEDIGKVDLNHLLAYHQLSMGLIQSKASFCTREGQFSLRNLYSPITICKGYAKYEATQPSWKNIAATTSTSLATSPAETIVAAPATTK